MGNIGADAAKLAGLQIDTLQKIRNGQITFEHLEWFNKLNKAERDKFAGVEGITAADPRFSLLAAFQFTVPENYDHSTQLASFAKENRKKFYFYNGDVTDANFAKATNRLLPGKTYEAKIFEITKRVASEDCLSFLKTQKALLVGAQGISIAWQQARGEFPKGKWTVSFDEKKALWQDGVDDHRVPDIVRSSAGDWHFYLGSFEIDWNGDRCLLCVRDLSA